MTKTRLNLKNGAKMNTSPGQSDLVSAAFSSLIHLGGIMQL